MSWIFQVQVMKLILILVATINSKDAQNALLVVTDIFKIILPDLLSSLKLKLEDDIISY